MESYFCLQDAEYRERPERITAIWKRFNEVGLVDRCLRVPVRPLNRFFRLFHHKIPLDLLFPIVLGS